jgi:hypothetical protein
VTDFESSFRSLTGHQPFPWQAALYKKLASAEFSAAARFGQNDFRVLEIPDRSLPQPEIFAVVVMERRERYRPCFDVRQPQTFGKL